MQPSKDNLRGKDATGFHVILGLCERLLESKAVLVVQIVPPVSGDQADFRPLREIGLRVENESPISNTSSEVCHRRHCTKAL